MYTIQQLFPERIRSDKEKWLNLLSKQNIRPAKNLDTIYGIFEGNNMIATGGRYQNILKCFAIDESAHGGEVFNKLSSVLVNNVFQLGFNACYIYTTNRAKDAFLYLGFKEITNLDKTFYFLEKSQNGLESYISVLKDKYVKGERIASIVMNANPFTKGHLYLVEKAAKENDFLHLFVLSEDLSYFPANVRMRLVKEGVAHLDNVFVHKTRSYMVSSATFPSYFLPEEESETKIQARLDACVFKKHIAPALGITHRYVGSEPLCQTTNIYNESMLNEFSEGGPKLIIVERKCVGDECISASRVRRLLKEKKLNDIKSIVPKTTYDYLISIS